MQSKPAVAIVGTGNEVEPAVSDARELGRLAAEQGWVLITGGRDAGVMRAANKGAKEAKGGLTIGILPDRATVVSPSVDVAIVADTGEARNNIIVLSAEVVVACGVNDPGTASEVALALKNGKPVVLLGVDRTAVDFFGGLANENVHVAGSPADAVRIAKLLIERVGKTH